MALIDCPECTGRVSSRAAACPHCGFPVHEHAGGEGEEERLLVVSPVLYGRNPLKHLLACLLCVVVVGFVMYLVEWLTCRSTRLIITSRRTILHEGIISRETNEVRHQDIRNIQVTQGAFDRLVGVGKLELSSAGQSNVEIVVDQIPAPQSIVDLIGKHR